jgi:hypothetical protein
MNALLRLSAVVAMVVLLAACDQPKTPTVPAATNAPAVASQPLVTPGRLLGRWLRPDGGYVLELRSVDTNGLFSASYLNPNPIHVERAEALTENGRVKLTVLLRDTGYPGCIYTLFYDEKADELTGRYYQAAMRESYDIGFTRLKESAP